MLPLQALLAFTAALSAHAGSTPSLTLQLQGAASVTDIDNFKVLALLVNTGSDTLKILNDPLSPLSTLPANTFEIVNSEGSTANFTGIMAKYVPEVAAKAGAYTTLKPGESVTVEHDLSEAYNLTATGAGAYDIKARNVFYLVNEQNKVSTFQAQVSGSSLKVHVNGRLAKARSPGSSTALSTSSKLANSTLLSKRANFNGCSDILKWNIGLATIKAHEYAVNAKAYLESMTTPSQRWTTWYGGWNLFRGYTVSYHFDFLRNNDFLSYSYDCTCTDKGVYAYVYPNDFGKVFLCGAFWNAPEAGTDSKPGTIIHEASHFWANGDGTSDYAYGQGACKDLARNDGDKAVRNADTYEYFAENSPGLP
ncbi:peptidyl-Lys metalloendopeptidase [Ephemerocybe angulata]|uniref:Peptidyl-Lys metalloendopeptidase n=1 Tax=Ephemerocybe angulata TaxID=980116 RepID=A0A8H6I7D4_9AGAR|nr:peptidyl-Lys metalloendopeptidase [Tulosesus angulatus]